MTMDLADVDRGLRAVLRELEPYLSDLVLIGGWVPYLFRHYGPFGAWEGRDTLTRELDVLVDNPLPREGPSSVGHASRRRTLSPRAAGGVGARRAGGRKGGVPHRARRSGVPAPLADQPGISVLPLPGLELLGDHTQVIHLPESDREVELRVRVPSLGAYIINKASTFLNRGGRRDEDGHLKAGKDLLYIRDLMAAPAVVIDHIEADMERIAGSAEQYAEMVRTGANHLGLVLRDGSHPLLEAVARMLIERDPKVPREDARARTLGYLTDLHEILAGVSERYTRD